MCQGQNTVISSYYLISYYIISYYYYLLRLYIRMLLACRQVTPVRDARTGEC
jgi:hypothetical protein